jgi:beta-D-xylosidase 4
VFNCTVATAKSIQAGTDVNCGSVYNKQIVNAVNSGLLKEEDVDVSFARLTKQQMLLGLFDNNKQDQPYFNLGINDIDTVEHQKLALEASQQSIVLLQNNNNLLPLKRGSNIVVIGPHFNATSLLLSNYHGSRCLDKGKSGPGSGTNFNCIVSPIAAIKKLNVGGSVMGTQGCDVASNNTDGIAAAVKMASSADYVILAMGIDQSQEREGLDRTVTTLPGVQLELISEVLKVANNKVVLVTFSGGSMSLGNVKDQIGSIVAANYGGEIGGVALADILFGDYNPTAKIAATWYPANYVNEIPLTTMSVTTPPGRTHMFYTGTPEFAFATGLSYTRWELDCEQHEIIISLSSTTSTPSSNDNSNEIIIKLKNVGTVKGKQTALMFWRPKNNSVRNYRQKLIGYKGTSNDIVPGEVVELKFPAVTKSHFTIHQDGVENAMLGEYELFVTVGGSEVQELKRRVMVVA